MMGGIGGARPAARALAGNRLQDTRVRNAVRSISDYIAATHLICGNHRAESVSTKRAKGVAR